MQTHSSKLIGQIAIQATRAYADMAGRLVCPESFIRDVSAQSYRQATSNRVCIELPIRVLQNEWGVSPSLLAGLGYFRVDMAAFKNDTESPADLDCLFEFKLWTDRYKVARDIRRLKKIITAIRELPHYERVLIGGYAVICPQYVQGVSAIRGAIKDFVDRFPVSYCSYEESVINNGTSFGIGVAVINVHDCIEGQYG